MPDSSDRYSFVDTRRLGSESTVLRLSHVAGSTISIHQPRTNDLPVSGSERFPAIVGASTVRRSVSQRQP